MGPIAWIVFGALAGWVGAKLAGDDQAEGCLTSIVVGIAGAVIGGALYELLTGRGWDFGFNVASFLVAVAGSVLLLVLLRLVRE